MATYGEIVTEVGLVVPVASWNTLVRSKVNQIIRLISTSGYFWRDIVESTIGSSEGVDAVAKIQSIPITAAIRKMIYVQYPESDTRIHLVNLEGLKKREACAALQDIAYLSGNALHIRHTELASSFNLAYYTNPTNFNTDGTEDALSNWITDLVPGLVVDITSSYILNLKGDNEDSKKIGDLAAMMRATYIRDFIDSVEGD